VSREAVNTSETSVSFYETTWRNIPEHGHFHRGVHVCVGGVVGGEGRTSIFHRALFMLNYI
jgi:hypothetical protein